MVISTIAVLLGKIIGTAYEDIRPSTPLTPEYGIEPIDVARLVIDCERQFNIIIHDEDVHSFQYVKDIAHYIEEKLEEKRGVLDVRSEADRIDWHYE